MANLPSNRYIICSQGERQLYVARALVEDRSLLPKRVVAMPKDARVDHWIVEALSSGRYRLSINGAPTAAEGGALCAHLINHERAQEWVITPQPHLGSNIFTIAKASGEGWVLTEEEEHTQVSVRPLIALPTEPPTYPKNELWSITPVEEE